MVASKAVTKTDFCLASRDQPSTAIGIYGHRVVCRSKGLFWSDCYAEYLVVTGTETELLRAWRTYSDFSSLAHTARNLGVRGAVDIWERLHQALGYRRRTDPSSLRTEARLLGRFLTTLLEELNYSDVGVSRVVEYDAGLLLLLYGSFRVMGRVTTYVVCGRYVVTYKHDAAPRRPLWQMLADFVREPTTYVVVGVEDVPCGTTTDASKKTSETHDEAPVRQSPVAGARNEIESSRRSRSCSSCSSQSSPGGGALGAAVRHPMKWQMGESLLKPTPRTWVGL